MLLTFRQYAGAGSKKAKPPKVNKIPMHSEFEGLAKTGMLLPSRMCRRREILIRLSSQRKSGGIFSIDEKPRNSESAKYLRVCQHESSEM